MAVKKGTWRRARQGLIRSLMAWCGNGIDLHQEAYAYKLPKKVRRLAHQSAFVLKVVENNFGSS